MWAWEESLIPGVRPRPKIVPVFRGGGKTTTAELLVTRLGCTLARRYVLYVCINQDRANERIQNIADNFEKLGIPRAIDQYGRAKGWKANMLRTADGFTVLGIGIETAARGANIEGYRPDVFIGDDIDASSDSLAAIEKKMNTLKRDIIPAGSQDLAVMFVENLMHENSVICQILDGRADFLLDVDVAEIIPAVRNLEVEQVEDTETHRQVYRITGGEATWEGYDLKSCEQFINSYGLKSFLIECQHEVGIASEGGLWSASDIDRTRISKNEAPEHYTRICVGVDPNVSANNDEAGIVVCGVVPNYKGDKQLHGFVLEDATVKGGPKIWAEAVVSAYNRWQADLIVAEKNNGGDLISITISTIPGAPAVKLVSASRGKITRAEPIQKLWVDQRVHMVGRFDMLEKEMTSYKPLSNMESPDRMDACWIGSTLISTEVGSVPIRDINVGDRVWTRKGLKRVTNCGVTNESADVLTFKINGDIILEGTENHPIYTYNRGFVPIGKAQKGDILCRRTSYTSTVFNSLGTQKAPVRNSPYTGMIVSKLVLVDVEQLLESRKEKVYNLEVEDCPEYFANGVLVHNCVWACSELMLGVKNTKEALTLAAKAVENSGGGPMSSRYGGVW